MARTQQTRTQGPPRATKTTKLCRPRSATKRIAFRDSREHPTQGHELLAVAQADVKCENGHPLTTSVAPYRGSCDNCSKSFNEGATLQSCFICFYDVCKSCSPKGQELHRHIESAAPCHSINWEWRSSEPVAPEPGFTASALRSDCRLQHLLPLKKGVRDHALNASVSERQQLYLLRKADEKVCKLARKNQKLSMKHAKGERRKTQRLGVGKGGSRALWGVEGCDIDAAIGHAHATMSGEPLHSDDIAEKMPRLATKPYIVKEPVPPKELQKLLHVLAQAGGPFEDFRAQFLKRHYSDLSDALDRCAEGRVLTPTPLAPELQQRFLSACHRSVSSTALGFHGTSASCYKSIFSHGLLIPGENNEIKVANGSVHGNGVYVAKVGNPWLSQSFATRSGTNKMLVCGVMDDSKNLAQTEKIGALSMTRKSDYIHHVGDAMVVFESARVAPLFVAEWKSTRADPPQPPYQPPYQPPIYYGHCGQYVRGIQAWELMKNRRETWLRKKFPLAQKFSFGWHRLHNKRPGGSQEIDWRSFFSCGALR